MVVPFFSMVALAQNPDATRNHIGEMGYD